MKNGWNKFCFALDESNIKLRWIAVAAAVVVVYPLIFNTHFLQNLGILTLMWICLGSAWNILGGYAGQVSLGQAMFFGVGAYGVAIPFYYWRITPWIGIFIGIAFAILLALLIAQPIFKLSAQYFAIATIALGETVRIVFVNMPLTMGMQGIDFLDFSANPLYSLQFRTKLPYYYLFAVVFALVIGVMLFINCTKIGYYFRTIKANQTAAESVGINAKRYKTVALIVSAVICSVCGSLYGQYLLYIDPSTVFVTDLSTKMIIMAVIGGVGTIQGPIIGALLLIPLSEYTRVRFGSGIPGLDLVIYGVLIILIIIYKPDGITAIFRQLRGWIQRRGKGAKKAGAGK